MMAPEVIVLYLIQLLTLLWGVAQFLSNRRSRKAKTENDEANTTTALTNTALRLKAEIEAEYQKKLLELEEKQATIIDCEGRVLRITEEYSTKVSELTHMYEDERKKRHALETRMKKVERIVAQYPEVVRGARSLYNQVVETGGTPLYIPPNEDL